ncbi:hypothetical protein AFLA_003100 [Aspergillus flavus NRRL3357]|nr:hypothetical protein AFLA_003100 [Aspergillus flavus NRRL3357]
MDADSGPYLRLAEQSQQSDTPVVSLELKAPETLFLESPLALEVILRRNDTDPRSCIFYWPPDIAARFVLLRHTSHGLERVEVAERRSEAPDVLYSYYIHIAVCSDRGSEPSHLPSLRRPVSRCPESQELRSSV